MSDPLRLLLTRRWIALTLFALLVVAGFGVLSHWQWDRAHRDETAATAAADPTPVPLPALLPGSAPLAPAAYGRSVTVTGTYEPATQRLVARGSTYFVITALRPAAGGAAVPVVRGTAAPPSAPAPPTGTVTVTGRLQPYDGDPGVQPSDADLPVGQVARITMSALAPVMGPDLTGGWVALSHQSPATPALPVITADYGPAAHGGLLWQNTTYAIQWVVFAGFVVFMWVRWFRDELTGGSDPEVAEPGPAADTTRGDVRSAT